MRPFPAKMERPVYRAIFASYASAYLSAVTHHYFYYPVKNLPINFRPLTFIARAAHAQILFEQRLDVVAFD